MTCPVNLGRGWRDLSEGHPAPRSPAMPQMFDWIFFAIMLPVPAYLVWDWMRNG